MLRLYEDGHIATWVEDNLIPNFILASAFSHFALYLLWQVGFLRRRQQKWSLTCRVFSNNIARDMAKAAKGRRWDCCLNKILIDILRQYSTGVALQGYPALTFWGGITLAWPLRVILNCAKTTGLAFHAQFNFVLKLPSMRAYLFALQFSSSCIVHKDCWALNYFWVVHVKFKGNTFTLEGQSGQWLSANPTLISAWTGYGGEDGDLCC